MGTIKAKARNKLPDSKFALPEERKYPIHDAAHTRNAAARLEQEKGSMSKGKYQEAKSRIAAAAKKQGVESKYAKKK